MDQAQNLRNIVKKNTVVKENEKKSRIITVTSGKGGVGKTSVSINLAIQFRLQGKSVIIFDADFGLANIEVMIGAIPKYNLSDLIYRGKDLNDIIMKGPMDIGFISGGSGISGLGDLTKDQLTYLVYKIKELESMADIIIIDTGAGISSAVMDFVVVSNEVILVTTPEPTSITDSYSLLKALNKRDDFDKSQNHIKIVANRVRNYEEGANLYNKLNVVVNKFLNFNIEFLGIIENDENMSKAVIQQKPISMAYPNSKGAKSFKKISDTLLEKKTTDEDEQKGLAFMLLGRFKRKK
ncbi:nucleotide-binding protein [Bovifimicola ammoniilytica]|jgi:flagellar biosynthesis protein FlhG|uniref:nucleotide-binding protein n=1 Tax=Bovifimicola ammoniilytica TaxID=2981720 RepID=UPI00033CF9AB|nr:P-loop NTPase [Bovifimicola ammoniilytica]MCU6753224.1 P-loop NTPase [Bovifimicola ammoniilytica]CCZ05301.1 site-determining protein [Eubacterium sp. CAG:603]SCJ57429.1 cell division inhibitor MinD [uncultured Eubacterium sp.]